MQLTAEEFLRRFLLHVLPKGFVRIRHYGVLASRHVSTQLAACRRLLVGQAAPAAEPPKKTLAEQILEWFGIDVIHCPHCGATLQRRRLPHHAAQPSGVDSFGNLVPMIPILDSS